MSMTEKENVQKRKRLHFTRIVTSFSSFFSFSAIFFFISSSSPFSSPSSSLLPPLLLLLLPLPLPHLLLPLLALFESSICKCPAS